MRELTRIDRAATPTAAFRWGDDGAAGRRAATPRTSRPVVPGHLLPALRPLRLGRRAGPGRRPASPSSDDDDPARPRQPGGPVPAAAATPPAEADGRRTPGTSRADGPASGSRVAQPRAARPRRRPTTTGPARRLGAAGAHHTSARTPTSDARNDTCPACGQEDGIRFLGCAIATLLSVSLSTLFGTHRARRRARRRPWSSPTGAGRRAPRRVRAGPLAQLTLRAVLRAGRRRRAARARRCSSTR